MNVAYLLVGGAFLLILVISLLLFYVVLADLEVASTDQEEVGITANKEGHQGEGAEGGRIPLLPESGKATVGGTDGGAEGRAGGEWDGVPPTFPAASGPGWQVWGVVSGSGEALLPGVRVRLRFWDGDRYLDPVDPVYTDDSGRYTAFLPASDGLLYYARVGTVDLEIRGSAALPGYKPGYLDTDELPDPEGANPTVRLDIALEPGATVHGRVLASNGNPQADARVFLALPNGKGCETQYTDSDGFYFFAIPSAGGYGLRASKYGEGTALSDPVQLTPDADRLMPDLVLTGPGEISGMAVYPDGMAAMEVEIFAYLASWKDRLNTLFMSSAGPDFEALHPSGLPCGRTLTGPDGRFQLSGLQPGTYLLQTLKAGVEEGDPEPPFFETGSHNVRLVVEYYRLHILLRYPEGGPVPNAMLSHDTERWNGASHVTGGDYWLHVPPGPVVLLAETPDNGRAMEEIQVLRGNYETEVVLVVEPPAQPGSLRIIIAGPDDKPVKRFSAMAFSTFLRTSAATPIYFTEREEDEEGGFMITANPGPYALHVQPHALDGFEMSPDNFFLSIFQQDVIVLSGEETPVYLEACLGGRIRMTVLAAGQDKKLPKLVIQAVTQSGRVSKSFYYFYPPDEIRPSNINALKPGIPYLSKALLEAGTYRLQVKAEGLEIPEQVFTIRPGNITDVQVWLEN